MNEVVLLDPNVLIALLFTDHIHHAIATRWFQESQRSFATCPITQSALVKFTLRNLGNGSGAASELLNALVSMDSHVFWSDDLPCLSLPWRQISGYRQVTDAYLVCLASHHGGRLVTLDKALATVFPEAILIGE